MYRWCSQNVSRDVEIQDVQKNEVNVMQLETDPATTDQQCLSKSISHKASRETYVTL